MNKSKKWAAAAIALAVAVLLWLPVFAGAAETNPQTSESTQADQTGKSNLQIVFEYLTGTLKLPSSAACGIMANIERESEFNPKATGDGGSSYGIVQWYGENFTLLRNYCKQYNLDYTTLSAQLQYMSYEFHSDYADVYHYLKRLSDDSYGAYKAGYYFCYHYERPSGYLSASESRGELAQKKYWPKFGKKYVSGEAADPKAPTVSGLSVPGSLEQGTRMKLEGTVQSNVELTQVTAGFYRTNEKEVSVAAKDPSGTSFPLSELASDIHSEDLDPGSYIFEVTAANAGGTVILLHQTVNILSRLTTLRDANVQFQMVDDRGLALSAAHDGSEVVLSDKLSFTDTHFQVVGLSGGYYSIRSLTLDKYLTTDANGRLGFDTWTGSNYQQWQFLAAAGSMMTILPRSAPARLVTVQEKLQSGEKTSLGIGTLNEFQLFRIVEINDGAQIVKPQVKEAETVSLELAKTSYTKTYSTKTFSLKVSSNGSLVFESSDPSVATVDSTGQVTMRSYGKTTIRVSAAKAGMESAAAEISVTVRPKKMVMTQAASASARQITVKWNRDAEADGYELQYSTSPKFRKKYSGSVASKTNNPQKCTVSRLTSGRVYYLRMRSYKNTDDGKIYSAWCKARKVTIK